MKKLLIICLAILFTFSFVFAGNINVVPTSVSLEGQKDGSVSTTFQIQNLGTEPITILQSDFNYDQNDFTDNDDDEISLQFSDLGTIPAEGSITAKVTASISSHMDSGVYDDNVNLTLGSDSDVFKLEVFVTPSICDEGKVGDLNVDGLEVKNHNDDFYPGDTLTAVVDISNEGDDDITDIYVEAVLYDLTDGSELTDWIRSDNYDLDSGDDKTNIDLDLEIPSDIDVDDDIVVFARVYEDDNEDENCWYKQYDDFEIKQKSHDIYMKVDGITPSEITCDGTFDVRVYLDNTGKKDESGVYVKVKDSTGVLLGQSSPFSLDSGDDDTKVVTVNVPKNIDAKEYSLETIVYYDSGDSTKSEFSTITVTCEKENTLPVANAGSDQTVALGSSVALDASKSTDADGDTLTYLWTQESGLAVEIQNPTSAVATVKLDKADTYVFKLTVNDGEGQSTDNVIVTTSGTGAEGVTGSIVYEESSFFGKIFKKENLSKAFWIMGILVLLLVAVYMAKLIIFPKGNAKEF